MATLVPGVGSIASLMETTVTTRRQQELEKQLACIISLMEEQKSNQAEQTQQLLDELKQHSEQLTKLAGENQALWESLTMKQQETSEAVSSLEGILGSVKAVMQDCIFKAEEELEQLHSWQEQLAGKQGEFQARIQEEFARLKLTMDRLMT